MPIGHQYARVLGINKDAGPQLVAEYLLRQAGLDVPARMPEPVATWLADVGAELAKLLPEGQLGDDDYGSEAGADHVAATAIEQLRRSDAPFVLGLVAPELIVGGCPAKDLPRYCRALAREHLQTFCRKVLATWTQDGPTRDRLADWGIY
jgi:cation transport regulator ChaB